MEAAQKQESKALIAPVEHPPLALVDKPKQELAFTRDPYQGISAKAFPQKAQEVLQGEVDPRDVEIRPDGIVYLPEIKYRRSLNKAFGAGGWALMPRSPITMQDSTMSRDYALFVDGRFVSEARGEQEYHENNPNMSYATASEALKSNALMRCCKDLGIASELWDPGFIENWKRDNAVQVWRKSSTRPQWRRKDRQKFYDEKEPLGERYEEDGSRMPLHEQPVNVRNTKLPTAVSKPPQTRQNAPETTQKPQEAPQVDARANSSSVAKSEPLVVPESEEADDNKHLEVVQVKGYANPKPYNKKDGTKGFRSAALVNLATEGDVWVTCWSESLYNLLKAAKGKSVLLTYEKGEWDGKPQYTAHDVKEAK